MKISKILIILFIFPFYSLADERCTEERKQWIDFYKKDFAQNFSKIEYADNPCFIEIITQEYKGNAESVISTSKQNIFNNLETVQDINWVPEYFELDANDDYLYGAQYFASKKYDEAAIFLSDFLENNSEDKLSPKAQFIYAETFRFRNDYIEAATQYLTGYEKFTESKFTPLYVMRLGEMMIKINYHKEGCELLNNVQNEIPPVNDDIYLETEQLMKTFKCPKVVTIDGETMLANLINNTKKLIK